jgi:hypothetical protein
VRGLRGIGPHDNVIVTTGDIVPEHNDVSGDFGTEAAALGAMPDVLIVIGGGPIAKKEIASAMGNAAAIIFAPGVKDYPTNSAVHAYEDVDTLRANASGPLDTHIQVVEDIADVATVISQLNLSGERLQASRHIRAERLVQAIK